MGQAVLPQRRRRSREIALQLLYALDLRTEETPASLWALQDFDEEDGVEEYARDLLEGTWDHRIEIDQMIRTHVVGWRPERMVAVDRAAVRLALFEGVVARKTPLAVAISEAMELAKQYGTEDSGRFVNGVLGKIVRAQESPSGEEP
ncbi:MAG TPA: transcription antitermination factor NusB [Synergistaceae bacterium]|nr:transcription antitermination factor NusB [Synergistaceae bacterium]HQF91067.1 transcription antitermination factor NusB [Synergistaceae bacterium]HQH77747.1 transcription antitermination factor NusB [Synergistaceae bacterium]HQK24417.1 transcription antitermination factor NusB [Synergistaceae bacterium]